MLATRSEEVMGACTLHTIRAMGAPHSQCFKRAGLTGERSNCEPCWQRRDLPGRRRGRMSRRWGLGMDANGLPLLRTRQKNREAAPQGLKARFSAAERPSFDGSFSGVPDETPTLRIFSKYFLATS